MARGAAAAVEEEQGAGEVDAEDDRPPFLVERVSVADLYNDPRNARRHPERNVEAAVASLRRFGQQKNVVVDGDGIVIAGNCTLEAARRLGWKTLDVHRTPLTGEEARAYALADNRTAELAEWDYETLAEELRSLESGFEGLGWEPYELAPLLAAEWKPGAPTGNLETPPDEHSKHGDGKHLSLSLAQRETVNRAILKMRAELAVDGEDAPTDGRCLEAVCAAYLEGAAEPAPVV